MKKIFGLLLVVLVACTNTPKEKIETPAGENTQLSEKADYVLRKSFSAEENFAVKGFHIDLRVQVMTLKALKEFAEDLASFGINTIIMEWEAAFPYQKHATISNKEAYTPEEVREFISYCTELGVDVIPLQQCFGHVEYILRHDRYASLREDMWEISQICPLKEEETKVLFKELFQEMAAMHPSKYIHIGCDETYLLGKCNKCAAKVDETSKSKLFVDYVTTMCEQVVAIGKIPILWADIILEHPEAVADLPEEAIFIDWNYGWNINLFGNVNNLLEKGCKFWGAPALRSNPDNYFIHGWDKHFNNLRDFIPYSRNAGYTGMVMTSWSTSGGYGFVWDAYGDVAEMHQIRNVYPLSGFRILVAAFAQSLEQKEALNPAGFVKDYAVQRFGLSDDEGKELWEALSIPPYRIVFGKVKLGKTIVDNMSISNVLDSVKKSQEILNRLLPKANASEFEHLRLMTDLRIYYLNIKKIEAKTNSASYINEDKNTILSQLEELMGTAKELDARFKNLNKDYLYESELEEEKTIRTRKMYYLYEKLKGRN